MKSDALRDLDQASRLDPRDFRPHVLFVDLLINLFKFDDATREINASSRLNPAAFAFDSGRIHFFRNQMLAAASDFRASERPSWEYPALWVFLAQARQGEDGRAELAAATSGSPKSLWPHPLAQFFLGEKTFAEVEALARNNDQLCEFNFYAGDLSVARGDRNQGMEALRRAAKLCPLPFIEASSARWELLRLERGQVTN